MTTENKDQHRVTIENIRDELTRVRDELRVRMHVASMDAKDEWPKIEPSLASLEHAWHDFSQEALGAALSLRERVIQLQARIDGHPHEMPPPHSKR